MTRANFFYIICFAISLLFSLNSWGTHNRAGAIMYEYNNGSYCVTAIIYTDNGGISPRDSLPICWGDGSCDSLLLTNTDTLGNKVLKNTYKRCHTYSGPFSYVISIEDPNRNCKVVNIPNSCRIPFYIEDTLNDINPQAYGRNNSAKFTTTLVPYACEGSKFTYNLGAYDPDGDSLSYELVSSKGYAGGPIPGYELPHEETPTDSDTMYINQQTGDVVWDVPQAASNPEYNFGILVKEYRNNFIINTSLVDVQVIVKDQCEPPIIKNLNDTCIVAGDSLKLDVWAKDPDLTDVKLTASGGPFQVSNSPATFNEPVPEDSVTGQFIWPTNCEHIRKQYYTVTFRAEDEDSFSNWESWRIKVVGPSPDSLTAKAEGNNIKLNWSSPYTCYNASHFQGFSVWRRRGSNSLIPDTCQPGLKGKGYRKIADNIKKYSYIDQNLNRGIQYCYRIQAEFYEGTPDFPRNKTVSLPSNEACDFLKRDLPIIFQADVWKTHPSKGKIEVAWLPPLANALDTAKNPGPYKYKIYRSAGFSPNNAQLIKEITSSTFAGLKDERADTVFIDSSLNTLDTPYTYKIAFIVDGDDSLGSTSMASSIYLSIKPSDNQLNLTWKEKVPWTNHLYFIYRSVDDTNNFNIIGNTIRQSYKDKPLTNGRKYCYYIESIGDYSAIPWLFNFPNKSQITCDKPIDTVPPCPPDLAVSTICDTQSVENIDQTKFINNVRWSNPNQTCTDDDAIKYNLYYKPQKDSTVDFQLLTTLSGEQNTQYRHQLQSSVAGCYAVTAIDSFDNESAYSNIVCKDNCPYYKLPNAFTPTTSPGQNDVYTPFMPYRFIDHVNMRIYNRWGQLVYQTNDPDINWEGKDMKTGKQLPAGVYHYVCEVYEIRLEGVVKKKKPLTGYIHILK